MNRGLALLGAAAVLGCRNETGGSGRIDVAWTGAADTGRFEAPARAYWCAADSVLEIIGESGDSGVAVVLFPVDSVRAGEYPVLLPGSNPIRPGARVALRWFGETMIAGYYSRSGKISVESASELEGTISSRLKGVNDEQELTLTGEFGDLRVVPGTPEVCGAETTVSADTGVR